MTKLRWQPLLMIITILGIAGFLLYWLKQNYDQQKKTLAIKSEISFRQAIEDLQVEKLKLDGIPADSSHKRKVKLFVANGEESEEEISVHINPKEEFISTINILKKKLKDSVITNGKKKSGEIILSNQISRDSTVVSYHSEHLPGGEKLFNILYGVDSLQDSLKLKDINKAYSNSLKQQKLDVPFTVSRLAVADIPGEPTFNEVTVGFAKPVTYKLRLGNTFPYLVKQISLPILFSILLLGITILSFVLLYRNLLRQRRLTAIKNEFIGNITHELKTPISTVSVAIEAMKNFDVLQNPQRTQEYLGIAGQELNRLSLLVDKVLRLSMFENRQVELKYEPVDVAELLNEVLRSMQLQFEKYHATVTTKLNGVDFTIEADRMHMTSVIYNLVDNALKYSKENPVINIETIANETQVVLTITDNGIGINAEYRDKIFEKFFRVPHGNTHDVKGYGLGLSYTAHIIERHHGSIKAESDGSTGTTFIIKLPRKNDH